MEPPSAAGMSDRSEVLVGVRDPRERACLSQALRAAGRRVREIAGVGGGLEALDWAALGAPGVLILDAPPLGQLVRDLRAGGSRVLLLVDQGGPELAPVADDFLLRPVRRSELLARVGLLLARGEGADLRRWQERLAGQTIALVSLVDLIDGLHACATLEEVLERVVTCAAGLARSREAVLLVPDAQSRELVVAAAAGLGAHAARGTRLAWEAGFSCQAAAACRPVIDPDSCAGPCRAGSLAAAGGARACVPLAGASAGGAGECLGVLRLSGRSGGGRYTHSELEYLQLLGHFATTTIRGFIARHWREQMRDSLTLALVSLTELRDNDTARHLERVTTFSVLLAEELRARFGFAEIDQTFLEELRRAVPLHDIGKVAIPDQILLKAGRLSEQEMAVMRTHTSIGADTIRAVRARLPDSSFAQMAEDIVRHHHEWYDGSGYPDGLAGEQIPLAARIVALADVYDALTTRRVYKQAKPHQRALAVIGELVGRQFDPRVGRAFFNRQQRFAHYAELLRDDRPGEPPQAPRPPGAGASLLAWLPSLARPSPSALQPVGA